MSQIYDFTQGDSPLLLSIPHAGGKVPDELSARFNDIGQTLIDTDWHVDRLYPFAEDLQASVIKAHYNRYLIDLNRSKKDTELYPGLSNSGLCPSHSFFGEPLYKDDNDLPDHDEIQERVKQYWQPYHDKIEEELQRKKMQHGYALLFDAHSIKSRIPNLFDGRLPDLNLGTNNGKACHEKLLRACYIAAEVSPYEVVVNERFIGGFITRHYGRPDEDIHALQMELIWDLYMDEDTLAYAPDKAERLSVTLHEIISAFIEAAANHYK